jgi:hypothetical protein
LRSDGHASRVKILEVEMKTLKEKLGLLLNKGNDDDALIDALKRELIATKQQQQQHQGSSARVTSAGREKPSVSTGGAVSTQLTSSLKSDLAKVLCAHSRLVSVPSIASSSCESQLRHGLFFQAVERAAKAEAQVDRQHKIIVALKGYHHH